jgi:hypothetical protein
MPNVRVWRRQPGSLTLSGKIQPDGKATIDASGMVGDPKNTALFDAARGAGKPCSPTFVK